MTADEKSPKKFIGLHSHSTMSIGDGIGMPGDHIDFAIENEMDALALTDHGNMNGFSHQYFHWQKLQKKGIDFKILPGVEAYYVDSLSDWRDLRTEQANEKKVLKLEKAKKKNAQAVLDSIGDQFAGTKKEIDELTLGGTVVEDESSSKEQKFRDPINQRNHLVLLPKNEEGLKALYHIISLSYKDGFYRYPRVDLDMLKKYSKGNIVALSACVAGVVGRHVMHNQAEGTSWDDWVPNDYNVEHIQKQLKNMVHGFQDALGEENYYLEMQFNKLGPQHLVNQHILECHKDTNVPLVVTCDAHYARPEHWREREVYKMLAWSSKTKTGLDKDALPKAIADLKCELYPKNAKQIWESYKETTKEYDFYDDDIILKAIEQTDTIAHDQIATIDPDRSVKLPSLQRIVGKETLQGLYKEFGEGITEDTIAFKYLKKKAIEGLVWRNKQNDSKYVARLKHELSVVRDLNFSKYFLTYSKIMEIVSKHMLIGNARGSAGGSLLAYVLNVTQLDPVRFGLLFERFLTQHKLGFPDIDCLESSTLVNRGNDIIEIKDLQIGDSIIDHENKTQTVLAIANRKSSEDDVLYQFFIRTNDVYGAFLCTGKHRLLNTEGEKMFAEELQIGQQVNAPDPSSVCIIIGKEQVDNTIELTDITVSDSATFQFLPFNCSEFETNSGEFLVTANSYSIDPDLYEQEIRKELYNDHTSTNSKVQYKLHSHKQGNIFVSSHNSDFSDRNEAVKLLLEHFGEINVIPVSNFNQLQLRSLLKDLCRLEGMPFDEVNKYTKEIEIEARNKAKSIPGYDAAQWILSFEEANNHSPTFRKLLEKYPDLEITIKVLFKQMRGVSRHAGGVIITDKTMDNMPIIKSGGVLQTPWPEGLNFRHLESFGMLKFDILGLGTLRMFEYTIRKILKKQGHKVITFEMINDFFYEHLHPDNNSMDDINIYKKVYWEGTWGGIFQFVQAPVQKFISQMKPKSIVDIASATSIFRPGPLCLSGDSEILIEKHIWSTGEKNHTHKTIKQLYEEFNNPKPGARYKYKLTSFNETDNKLFRNEIVNVIKSGKKKVFALKTRVHYSGSTAYQTSFPKKSKMQLTIKATLDHRFLTKNGWKRLEDIKQGEYLYILNKYTANKDEKQRTKGIFGERNFANIAFRHYEYNCVFCDWKAGALDVNHLEGNRKTNNSPKNLGFLCPNHHRQFSEKSISLQELKEANENYKLVNNDDVRMVQFLGTEYVGEEDTYDISVKGPHHNFIAGGFIVHNSIAADKLYLKNRRNPEGIVYKHPLLEEVLSDTYGLIVFQEQLQLIYHKLAGVPLDETDNVRKSFTKKDIANKEQADIDRKKLRETFKGLCLAASNIEPEISYSIFDEMEEFVAYSFNQSHATACAITSYQCAWFMYHYPDEWITTYIDYAATEKGKVTGKTDPKAVALSEAQGLGYEITKPDINLSERDFSVKDGKLVPSFASLKHCGHAVVEEIFAGRPYKSIEDLLFNDKNKWKHSKFNKRAMATLIKLEAFDSMDIVGSESHHTFANYNHMHEVIIEHNDELKRMCARKTKRNHRERLIELIEEYKDVADWTLMEKVKNSKALAGSVDINMIITPELKDFLYKTGIPSIDRWTDKKTVSWAIVNSSKVATTKTGKTYLRAKIYADSKIESEAFLWGFNPEKHKILPENTVILAPFDKNGFGFSSFYGKIETIERE